MKRFYGLCLIFAILIFTGSVTSAANIGWRYQFDDVAGYPSGSGVGAQWVALTTSRDFRDNIVDHSIGEAATVRMSVETDLVASDRRHSLFVLSDDRPPIWEDTPFLHSAFLVIPEGTGTMPVNFKYTGGSAELVTLAVYAAGFEETYRVEGNPTPPFPQDSDVNVDVSFAKISGNERYNSEAGELVFHQNPTSTPSQTLHIPFVVASVRDGDATGDLLDIKSTTRTTSGDIVARRWFKWDAQADKVEPAYADDWIFVPLDNRNPDIVSTDYDFTTEVTNHSGLRYGIQRYDDRRALSADHWKFDLSPINPSLRMSLPPKFWLHPLSHIAPGLVTVYSHAARVMTRQQNLLRIAAVDPTGQLLSSKALQLNYRTIMGYSLGSADDTHYSLNAFEAYPSRTDFFKNALKAMDISSTSWKFPSREDSVPGAVWFEQITADAISSFAMSTSVPWMGDGASSDISVPAMLGLHVVLQIPRARIEQHWDNFAKSRTLAADFAEKYRVWFRSPNGADLDLTQFLRDEGKYDRTVKVFLDEENENLTVHYVLLTIEESSDGRSKRPRVRMVSDNTVVNDYDYIVVDDGVNDGVWEMTFYVAPEVIIPPKQDEEGGGGGCNGGVGFLATLLMLPFLKLRSARKTLVVVLLGMAMFVAPAEAATGPAMVSYNSDIDRTITGSLRWAIDQANLGAGSIVFNDIDVIFLDLLDPALGLLPALSEDVEIYGNGAKIDAGGNGRLFEMNSGANVTFNAITFANGSAPAGENGGAVLVTDGHTNFEFCTFDENSADNGGAVYVELGGASFTNCTFFENSAIADGGAVADAGGAGTTLTFSFVTMYGNTAGGNGQAINAQGTGNTLLASLVAGNGTGQQIAMSGASISRGYNVFGDSFINATTGTDDFFSATVDNIFNVPIVPARNDSAPGWKNWTYTLSLINNSNNPALGRVPRIIFETENVWSDQRLVERGAGGAGVPSSSGAFEVYDPSAPVESLQIGGLPNGIATVGYTALLAVRVNPPKANPGVSWTTSDANVVSSTAFGRVFSVGKGNAVLTVTTTGYDVDGKRKTQQIPIIVKYGAAENPNYDQPDPNVSPTDPPSNEGDGGGGGGCNAGFAIFPIIFLSCLFFGRRMNMKNKFLMILILLGVIFASAQTATATFVVDLGYTDLYITINQPETVLTPKPVIAESGYTYILTDKSMSKPGVITWGNAVTGTIVFSGAASGDVVISCDMTKLSSDGSSADYGNGTCSVHVVETGTTRVELDPPAWTFHMGTSNIKKTIVPIFHPTGAAPASWTWETSNSAVASVDKTGEVIASSKGTATITYRAMAIPAGGGVLKEFVQTCQVTVLQAVKSINISPTTQNVTVGGTKDITVTYLPTDADSVDVEWSIVPNDATIATIASKSPTSATFNAVSFIPPTPTKNPSTVKVTAKSKFWTSVADATCDVIIDPIPITDVLVTPTRIVSRDFRIAFNAAPVPANATKSSDSLMSSNPLVAEVDQKNNLVIGKSQGTATITYTFNGWAINAGSHDAKSYSDTCIVTVISPPPGVRVSGINVSPTTLSIRKGASYQLFPTVIPHDAADKTVFWTSSNPVVATVSTSGVVSAHSEGSATISVITADAGVGGTVMPATCAVTVTTGGGGVPNDPAYLPIDPGVKQQIEGMNKVIASSGVEVGFGFELERPNETSLVDYGVLPAFLSKLDASSNVKIELAPSAKPEKFETVGSASKFEINVAALSGYGWTAVVPVSLKLTLTDAMLGKYLPSGTSVSAVLANPRPYLGALFTAFSLQKQIIDTGSASLNKFMPLFATPQAALLAVDDGVLFVKTLGSKLEITLNYFVADSDNTTANYIENNLIIGDGAANGIIRDPVWLLAPAQGGGGGGGGGGDSGGGGGCNAAGFGVFALIVVCGVRFRTKKPPLTEGTAPRAG